MEESPFTKWWPESYVYVANLPGYGVKIGHSVSPEGRVEQLRQQHGSEVSLAYTLHCESAIRVECRAHALLKEQRLYGEWFDVSVDDGRTQHD